MQTAGMPRLYHKHFNWSTPVHAAGQMVPIGRSVASGQGTHHRRSSPSINQEEYWCVLGALAQYARAGMTTSLTTGLVGICISTDAAECTTGPWP
jgi:hypothetical protein